MSQQLRFVQGDTRPPLLVYLRTKSKQPIDVSDAGTTIVLKMRAVGQTTVKDTVAGIKVAGVLLDDDVTVDSSGPYAVPGAGGGVEFPWNPTSLDTDGTFESEVEITFSDGRVQTVFDVVKFKVRQQF